MLRPLRIGEIFDRAITLCVTNFVPLAVIALFYVVPLAVLSIFQQRDTVQSWQTIFDASRGHTHAVVAADASRRLALTFGVFAFVILIAPFVHMGIAAAIAQRYGGEPVRWPAALRAALRRWSAVLGMLLFAVLTFLTVIFAGSLGLGIFIGLSAVMAAALKAVGILFAIVAIVAFLAWLLFLMVLLIALFFMFFALVLERAPVFAAIGSGFARIFNRKELLRALAMGLAFLAIEVGLTIVSYTIIGVVDIVWHQFVAGALALSLVNLITVIFSATVFTVYYFDVRVRHENIADEAQSQPLMPVTQP